MGRAEDNRVINEMTGHKLIIVKLGDGYIGICYTILSILMNEIFHNKKCFFTKH